MTMLGRRVAFRRYVRTAEGSRRYELPIGSPIEAHDRPGGGRHRAPETSTPASLPPTLRPSSQPSPDELAADYRAQVQPTADEVAIADAYQGPGMYKKVNKRLRVGETLAGRPAEVAAGLDQLMQRHQTTQPLRVYRGMGNFVPADTSPGAVIEDLGFSSSTLSEDVAKEFTGDGVSLDITVPTGFNAVVVNGAVDDPDLGWEKELLLPRGTRYVVLSEEEREGKRWLNVVALPPTAATAPPLLSSGSPVSTTANPGLSLAIGRRARKPSKPSPTAASLRGSSGARRTGQQPNGGLTGPACGATSEDTRQPAVPDTPQTPDGDPPPPGTSRPDDLTYQPEEGAMADTATIDLPEAPAVEVIEETPGEMRVRFPVLVLEGADTSDGRFLEPGSLTPRGLPLSLLAQPEASHGGDEPGPSVVIGRLDSMERKPGPEVISKRTGEPFPEGTFVWSATGAIDANHPVADLVRRGYLRGVSVDLAGMDYDVLGMLADDEGGLPIDPDNPRRQLVTHSAEIAAATLVPIPAFGDAYVELDSEDVAPEPIAAEDLPEGLAASAFPAWRSPEVGDLVAVVAAADEGMPVRIPPDSVEQIAAVIDTGEERDATALATAIVEHIAQQWALEEPVTEEELPDGAVTAAAGDEVEVVEEVPEGDPESAQPCQYGPEPAVASLVFRDGDAYLPTCAEHRAQAEEELTAAGEVVAEVVDIEQDDDADEDEPEMDDLSASGAPDAPQVCAFADHPAALSLLFAGGTRYAATCREHEQAARDEINVRGDEVTGTVTIGETP